jgi:ATP-binding cassette subfamily B protein
VARREDFSLLKAWREHWSPQVGLLPRAGAGLLAAVAGLEIILGLLPVAVMVAIAAAIARTPQVAAAGAASPAAAAVMLALVIAAAAFGLVQLLAPLVTAMGTLLQQRVDGYCTERLMAGALLRAPYSALEDSRALDSLTDAAASLESGWSTPGAACAGLMALLARYSQLAAALVLVAALYSPWLAVLLLVVALMIRRGRRSWQRQERLLWRDLSSARRKVLYLRRLGTGPAAAKEIRMFGLIDWLRGHYRLDSENFLGPLSRQRRRIGMRPFFYYSTLAFACGALAFFLLIRNFAAGQLSLFYFILFLQVLRVALLFGDNFPECDDSLTFGNRAFHSMLDFEHGGGI